MSKIKVQCNLCSVTLFIFLFFTLCDAASAQENVRSIEKKLLDSLLEKSKYDSRIRPRGVPSSSSSEEPVMVRVNTYIRSISNINDRNMEYTMQLTFRAEWMDDRLKYHSDSGMLNYLSLTEPEKIWKPDVFFSNEKEGHFHDIIMPNVLLRIHPNGNVLYSIRITLTLSCEMDLRSYPFDTQECSMLMVSYGYTTNDMVLMWKAVDPVQVTKSLKLPRFTLKRFTTDYCTSKTNTGEYSCLKVIFTLQREWAYYLVQIYIPCCMLVIVSWVSFWLDPQSTLARVFLGVTTLLTMATTISGINVSLPPVSYTKAIDIWTGICMTFLFGALLEFAVVNYLSRKDCIKKAIDPPNSESEHEEGITAVDIKSLEIANSTNESAEAKEKIKWKRLQRWLANYKSRSERVDAISRIAFPAAFGFFTFVYICTYLT